MRINFNWKRRGTSERDDEAFSAAIPHDEQWAERVMKSYTGIQGSLSSLYTAPPPFDPFALWTYASKRNGYHSACIHLKKNMIVGGGFDGDPQLLEWLDNIETEAGLASLFLETALDMETFGYAPLEVIQGIPTVDGPQWALYRMAAVATRAVPPRYDMNGKQITPLQYLQFSYLSRNTGVLDRFWPTYFDPFGPGVQSGAYMLKLPSMTGNYWYGEPEYTSTLELLAMNVSVVDYAKKIFSQGMMADGVFIGVGTQLSSKKRNELKRYLSSNFKGLENAHRIGFIQIGEGETMQWVPMNATMDANYSTLRKDNRDEIIMSHLLPPRIVGVLAAGSLGGTGEVEGQLKIVKLSLIDPRQILYESQWKNLFRSMGAPMWNTFRFKELDISAGSTDAAALSAGVAAGWLPSQEALDEWNTEKSMERRAGSLIEYLSTLRSKL